MISLVNIQHVEKVISKEFENNWKELQGKNDENFLDLCYIKSKLKTMIKRMEKENHKQWEH